MHETPEDIQRAYYVKRASTYNAAHVNRDEHYFALGILEGLLDQFEIASVLDVGAGTGRALFHLRNRRPTLDLRGIEPVAELRAVAYAQGFPASRLTEGSALNLPFEEGAFDLVCAFGIMHHIATPNRAAAEMLRVARRAVFISDCNNFGQGSWAWRTMKQGLHALGLWPLADWIKTRGKGYQLTDGDGLAYSYSIFDTHGVISRACADVYTFNTVPAGPNPYRSASHAAIFGVKSV